MHAIYLLVARKRVQCCYWLMCFPLLLLLVRFGEDIKVVAGLLTYCYFNLWWVCFVYSSSRLSLYCLRMRIKVSREAVIDKLNPLDRSPKHKKLPAVLRSKTPEKARRADVISPRQRKDSFVSPKRSCSVEVKKRSKARAVNLVKLFNQPGGGTNHTSICKTKPEKQITVRRSKDECEPEIQISREMRDYPIEKTSEPDSHYSLVSMKTNPDQCGDVLATPPPLKIKRSWKKQICRSFTGYKLFTPDSPAKAAASPQNLAVKLCFLGKLSSEDETPLKNERYVILF